MNRILLGLLLLSLMALAACDSGGPEHIERPFDVSTLTFDASLLPGTWDLAWTESFWGGREGPVTGPATTLVLGTDGSYVLSVDGEIVRETRYAVETRCNPANDQCYEEFVIADQRSNYWRGVSEEWLIFDSSPMDGTLEAYRRR